jgi:hypothetical protein
MQSPEMNEMLYDRLETLIRDMTNAGEQPVTVAQSIKLVEMALNHPTKGETDERPYVDILDIVLHRLNGDQEAKAKLEKTPMKPVIAFIPLFTQVISETKDIIASQS